MPSPLCFDGSVVSDARVASDELDARAVRWCFREALVAGEKRCIERFSKGYVYGVVRGKVVSQVPNARHQDAVRIPGEWEAGEIVQRSAAALCFHFAGERVAAQNLRHLHVKQMRRVQCFCRLEQAFLQRHARRHAQKHLEHHRGIEDDQRLSRSARTACAGGTEGVATERCSSVARSSSRDGRSATRPISCSK